MALEKDSPTQPTSDAEVQYTVPPEDAPGKAAPEKDAPVAPKPDVEVQYTEPDPE